MGGGMSKCGAREGKGVRKKGCRRRAAERHDTGPAASAATNEKRPQDNRRPLESAEEPQKPEAPEKGASAFAKTRRSRRIRRAALSILAAAALGASAIALLPSARARLFVAAAPALADMDEAAEAQAGDLVFRMGTDGDSAAIAQAGRWGYSHAGLVTRVEGGVAYVTHATTDSLRPGQNGVILSEWGEFASPDLARRFALYRPQGVGQAALEKAAKNAESHLGETFSLDVFERGDPVYCTTLIERSMRDAAIPFHPPRKELSLAGMKLKLLMPRDLLNGGIEYKLIYERRSPFPPRARNAADAPHSPPTPQARRTGLQFDS